MISLESKTQTSAPSSPLSLSPTQEDSDTSLSFSELLRGVSLKKDEKIIQNGALILALDEKKTLNTISFKSNSLAELLKGEKKEDISLPLELNPEVTKNLTPKELKVLIKDAKEYLKNKIIESEGFKKSEITALPKTLKGLAQVAIKVGIDISKITLQEVKPIQTMVKAIVLDAGDNLEVKVKIREGQVVSGLESDVVTKKVLKIPLVGFKLADSERKQTQEVKPELLITQTDKLLKEIKAAPLFKAQAQKEITTQELVNTKINTIEASIPKKKRDETLKLLLRGESIPKGEKGFTADFSVATARVLAPQATKDISKSLESLLKGESKENPQSQKIDAINITKADSFEVKLNEAKQMTKYLSQDVKTAIEDYKSPFTRIKVQLNPQRLGAVELTVVQRGKNLHINLSSNNAAINALALNANDLKVQLTNSGINNATLNFNSNSQNPEQSSSGQQQQNSSQERQAKEEYNYFTNEEQNEEVLNSLEIIVPNYA